MTVTNGYNNMDIIECKIFGILYLVNKYCIQDNYSNYYNYCFINFEMKIYLKLIKHCLS